MNKLLIIAFFSLYPIYILADCQCPDRKHVNKDVSRCLYSQENIYKAFAEKPGHYGNLEKYKKCFFCECSISEHTTEVKKEVKKKEKKVIDNSLTHG